MPADMGSPGEAKPLAVISRSFSNVRKSGVNAGRRPHQFSRPTPVAIGEARIEAACSQPGHSGNTAGSTRRLSDALPDRIRLQLVSRSDHWPVTSTEDQWTSVCRGRPPHHGRNDDGSRQQQRQRLRRTIRLRQRRLGDAPEKNGVCRAAGNKRSQAERCPGLSPGQHVPHGSPSFREMQR